MEKIPDNQIAFYQSPDGSVNIETLFYSLEAIIAVGYRVNSERGVERYNSGAHDIDQLFGDLVNLAKSLDEEEQRATKENLSEDELAIFDLLVKENLNPNEVEEVKKASHELLKRLKLKLVLDWREREPTRAGVKTTISDTLYSSLPEPTYTEEDCEIKGLKIYNFVYERYRDAKDLVSP